PAFFVTLRIVLASMRVLATVSPSGFAPVIGESLPSYLVIDSQCLGVPSAAMPSEVTLVPDATTSHVAALLFGTGPGSYFDLAGLSLHMPMCGSGAWATTVAASNATNSANPADR